MDAIDKYLKNFAEDEIKYCQKLAIKKQFEYCLVIPVFDETIEFVNRLTKLPKIELCLIIIVINQPTDSSSSLNTKLWKHFHVNGDNISESENLHYIRFKQLQLIVVDRYAERLQIPKKFGVGMARKIGCDIACYLYRQKILNHPWVFSTDADTTLPNNYLHIPKNNASAFVFEFKHLEANDKVSTATTLYESAIKYYCRALKWAGSPYAYYTLGSIIAINLVSYSIVRGFPKRSAGEDFYLLNKLNKIKPVVSNTEIKISIEPRLSNRAPFGTGPAVSKILDAKLELHYYNPEIFVHLKQWLVEKDIIWQSISKNQPVRFSNHIINECIDEIHIKNFILHIKNNCKSHEMFLKAFHDWFDAFMTLKFVHLLKSRYYPDCPIENILANENLVFC